MPTRFPSDRSELKARVRDLTSYDDNPDELPDSQLEGIIDQAMDRVELETGSSAWFSDNGLGFALVAYTCMRAKAAIENVALSGYSIGDEQVTFASEDPEDSAQYQQWAEDVRVGLDASDKDTHSGPALRNSTSYIGDSYTEDKDTIY